MQVFYLIKDAKGAKLFPSLEYITDLNGYLEDGCLIAGCTLKGRIDAFHKLLATKQKGCILFSIQSKIFWMPLYSLNKQENILLNYFAIQKIIYISYYQTKLLFIDNSELVLPFNNRLIKRQFDRCRLFLSKLCYN